MLEWLPFPTLPEPEHPDVAAIEEILGDPSGDLANALSAGRQIAAELAVWICACITEEETPVWLIVDSADGPKWCRVPINAHLEDPVTAGSWAGGHPAPEEVLAWLQGEGCEPAIVQGGAGDPETLSVLGERIRNR